MTTPGSIKKSAHRSRERGEESLYRRGEVGESDTPRGFPAESEHGPLYTSYVILSVRLRTETARYFGLAFQIGHYRLVVTN
jgi:hypothetical protein